MRHLYRSIWQNLNVYGEGVSEIPLKQRRKLAKILDGHQRKEGNRDAAIVCVYASGGYTMAEISSHFGCHYSTVSRVVAKYKT